MPTTSTVARLISLQRVHREILKGGFPNATSLAHLLEVSTKTAQKYVRELSELSPVAPRYDRARHGYHYSSQVSPQLAPRLKEEEVIAYFLLEESARCLAGTPVKGYLDSALAKFSMLLPTGDGLSFDDLSTAMSVRLERAPAHPPMAETLAVIYRAVLSRHQIRVQYVGRERKETTKRILNPLHLTRCEGQWYVVAWCHLRQAVRTFVPARMKFVELLSKRFDPPPEFDAAEHFKAAFGIVAGPQVAEISLIFDSQIADLVAERQWHSTQRFERADNGCVRMKMNCTIGHELLSWLMSWGANVAVERPKRLRDSLREQHFSAATATHRVLKA